MNTMKILRSLFALPLVLASGASLACWAPKAEQLIGVDEQLAQARTVVVGQLIGATPLDDWSVEYRFLVLEQLAGQVRKVVTVTGGSGRDSKDSSFGHHQDPAFWVRGGGRTMNGADCVIRPGFVAGNSYLLFLGSAPTWRSFEKIEMSGGVPDQEDKWLAYVKARLAGKTSVFRQKS